MPNPTENNETTQTENSSSTWSMLGRLTAPIAVAAAFASQILPAAAQGAQAVATGTAASSTTGASNPGEISGTMIAVGSAIAAGSLLCIGGAIAFWCARNRGADSKPLLLTKNDDNAHCLPCLNP